MKTRKGPLAGLGFALLSTSAVLAAADAPVVALWKTDDGAALVRIAPCGQKLCGTVAQVLDPKAPPNDINNPDPVARTRPLLGKTILQDFVGAGTEWKSGKAYDPKSGRTYKSQLELQGNGTLKVTGCVLFVCQSRYWTRAASGS